MKWIILIALLVAPATPSFAQFFGERSSGQFSAGTVPTLTDVTGTMSSGDWKKLTATTAIADVLVTQAEALAIAAADGGVDFSLQNGAQGVFNTWNSAAYDPDGRRWLFIGGGHAGYGGNEVYQFDFDTRAWTREIEPSAVNTPYTAYAPERGLLVPETGPVSSHTYDDVTWNAATQSLWRIRTTYGYASDLGESIQMQSPDWKPWEYTMATGQWTAGVAEDEPWWPAVTYLDADGVLLLINNRTFSGYTRHASIYDANGDKTYLNSGSALPGTWPTEYGILFTIPETADPAFAGRVFLVSDNQTATGVVITEYAVDVGLLSISSVDTTAVDSGVYNPKEAGWAFNPDDNLVYIWNGDREVWTWNITTGGFTERQNLSSPTAPNPALEGYGRVYDKWIYLEGEGVFAGFADAGDGEVWLWKP